MPLVESFDGIAVGPGTPYDVCFADSADYQWTQDLSLDALINRTPRLRARFPNAWTVLMRVLPGDTAPADMDEWRADAIKVFNPHKGQRTLGGSFLGDSLELTGTITRATHPAGMPMNADARSMLLFEFVSVENAWRVVPASYPTASPLTVGGNYPALPEVVYTPAAATLKRVRIAYVDTTGRGLKDHWIRSPTFSTTGLSITGPENFIAFYQGRIIPCYVRDENSANTTVDCRVSPPADGTEPDCFVDVFYGSAVSNADFTNSTFEYGGIALEDAGLDNGNMVWNDLRVAIFPDADFSWRPCVHGQPHPDTSFGIVQQGATIIKTLYEDSLEIDFDAKGVYNNDANGIITTLGREAGSGEAFSFTAQLILDAGDATAFIEYWIAGAAVPQLAYSITAGSAVTDTADVEGAVKIVVYVLPQSATAVGRFILTVASGTSIGPWECAMSPYAEPDVTVSAPVDACLVDGVVITNTTTGDTISIDDVYMDEDTITIDCLAREITTPTAYYVASLDGGPIPSERDLWFALLEDAANTLTVTGGGSVECAWSDRWLI